LCEIQARESPVDLRVGGVFFFLAGKLAAIRELEGRERARVEVAESFDRKIGNRKIEAKNIGKRI